MAGVTDSGIQIKTPQEVRASLAARFRGKISADLNTTEDGIAGRIVDAISPEIADVWEALGEVYISQDVAQAEGEALRNIGASTSQDPATKTRISATVTLGANVTLLGGSAAAYVVDRPDLRGTLVATIRSAAAGDYSAIFSLDEPGAFPVFAGTFTEIATPQAGWLAVTNAADAATGEEAESPEDYRQKILQSQALGGSGTQRSMLAALVNLDGVRSVTIFENASETWDGLPPHSFEALIHDFDTVDNDLIAQTIFDRTCGGFSAQGSSSGTALESADGESVEHSVRFSRPLDLDYYVTATVDLGGLTAATVKQRLAELGNAKPPGTSITYAQVIHDLFEAGAVDVLGVSHGLDGVLGTSTVTVESRARAAYDTLRISINGA
jgi:hypothetical protein